MLAEEPHGPPPFAEPTPREALSVHVVRIAIGEPVTEGFGPRRFTSYQLSSAVQADRVHAAGDLARAPPVACRRRFSEFLKLREELLEAFPGVVLPPLPEKQTVGRFDPEFVEKRRLKLEAFLAHCVAHPLLCCCVQLAAFCVWPEQLTALVRLNAPTEYVPAGDSWGRDGADPLKSALPDVVAFEAQARKLREALKSAQRRALDTSLEQMELAQAWSSFGHSDFNYGLRPSLSRLSDSMGALSALTRTQAESDSRSVLAALRMYIDLAEAISEQCRRRDASAKALEALAAELRAAQAAAARASGSRGASPAADKKAADLDERLSELTKRHAAAAARLSLHSRTLAAELGRFTAHKDADLGRALVQLVGEQALSADRVAAQWRALMPGVDARPQQHANGTAAHTSADAHAHSQLPARAAASPYVSTPTPAPHPEPRTPNPSVGSAGLAAAGGGSAEDFSSGFIAHLSAASMAQRQGTPAGR